MAIFKKRAPPISGGIYQERDTMKKLESISNLAAGREAKVYRDSEWQEWRVKFYQDGQHLAEADYHTDDKGDAQHTARSWAWKKEN
jgi:hypothetical protein